MDMLDRRLSSLSGPLSVRACTKALGTAWASSRCKLTCARPPLCGLLSAWASKAEGRARHTRAAGTR